MQRCTTCGTTYEDSISTCPRDGTPLFATESDVQGLVEVSSEGVATLDELSDAIEHWQREDSEAVEDTADEAPTQIDDPEDLHGDPTLIINTAEQIAMQDREREAVTPTLPIGENAVAAPAESEEPGYVLEPIEEASEPAPAPEPRPAPSNAPVAEDDPLRGTRIGAPGIVDEERQSPAPASKPAEEPAHRQEIEPRERAPSAVPVSAMPTADDEGSGMLLFGFFVVLLLLGAAGTMAHVMGVFSFDEFFGAEEPVAEVKEEPKAEPQPVEEEEIEPEEEPEPQPAPELAEASAQAESLVASASAFTANFDVPEEPAEDEEGARAETEEPAPKSQARKKRPRPKKQKAPAKAEKAPAKPAAKPETVEKSADDQKDESLNVWGSSKSAKTEKAPTSEKAAKTEKAATNEKAAKPDADDSGYGLIDEDEDSAPEKAEPEKGEPKEKAKPEPEKTKPEPEEEADEEEDVSEDDSLDIW